VQDFFQYICLLHARASGRRARVFIKYKKQVDLNIQESRFHICKRWKMVSFTRKEVNRAINEFVEYISNITNSKRTNYNVRLRQLFELIDNNLVLKAIIDPYLNLEFDDSRVGFLPSSNQGQKYIVPIKEDEEIALILKVLKDIGDNNKDLSEAAFLIYFDKTESLSLFNNQFIVPAFNKLLRKLQYINEDILEMSDTIDPKNIQIIKNVTINANDSMVAVGHSNMQISKLNVFEKVKNEIGTKIGDQADRDLLLQHINLLEKNINDKGTYKQIYDAFLLKIGTYMTIIGPFLPVLSSFFA
jgi:hypothetical protein